MLAAFLAFAGLCAGPATEAGAAAPRAAWLLDVTALPTNLPPGGNGEVFLNVANVGGAPSTAAPVLIHATLPAGVLPTNFSAHDSDDYALPGPECANVGPEVTCTQTSPVAPGRHLEIRIFVSISPGTAEGAVPTAVTVEGGGAAARSDATSLQIGSGSALFALLPGSRALPLEADGEAATAAGSHPYALDLDFGFPTEKKPGTIIRAAGHVRDITNDLPAGEVVNPTATPVRCTEAELEDENKGGCPEVSEVGTLTVRTNEVFIKSQSFGLYNMVPPPGQAAELGANAFGVGIYLHIKGGVRSDGDYGITATTSDILALTVHPVFGVHAELWGDPSSAAHDLVRGGCIEADQAEGVQSCPVPPGKNAMLTLPGSCPSSPALTGVRADSWEEPGVFTEAATPNVDLDGTTAPVAGCNQLSFEPSITAKPTTNLADSPSGIDVDLHQPQTQALEQKATAALRDAIVTLPKGMAVNPSQANGLEACTEQQIGRLGESAGIQFSKQPPSCPDASKLGTLEVTTPLLAEYEEGGKKLVTDPETGEGIPRPLHGSVYLAQPFKNPLGSLLAIYLSVEDPQSGTYAKLIGEVAPDPQSGQITTVFKGNPQLPLEDVRLHLFGGARGALITPIACGGHATTTTLTPWSSPEGADAHPTDTFQTTAAPGGGTCPGSEAAAPNAPAFTAGTLAPQAGAYSPFVLKLSREDGSQRLTGIDTTLAPGLLGKLAGIPACSEAQIAQAQARSHSEEGRAERESPSCPLSTEVGTVTVAAGAGPTPYYTSGHAYLAGPYKGAPVSLAVITPAVAGPFDLGVVVTRVALHVEPETAQIHAVSDPLPTILQGIPLDVRSVALKMDRPQFTLNPTSCDPMAIVGQATSALGQTASLSQRFQVGGCSGLPFKPRLSLRLEGKVRRTAHPRLIANLAAKPGEANIARAQVKLPPSVFLDQAHIRTICTRVQFAADACPAGSVYGKAEATSPLLGYPVSGPVYLRSNPSRELPDLVAKLQGPASQPIEVDLVGKTDSVHAALRNTFEAVPDAPVSSFRLELFGGKRGLVEMSDGFCSDRKATVKLDGQNGKAFDTRPVVGAKCPKAQRHRGKPHGKRAGSRG